MAISAMLNISPVPAGGAGAASGAASGGGVVPGAGQDITAASGAATSQLDPASTAAQQPNNLFARLLQSQLGQLTDEPAPVVAQALAQAEPASAQAQPEPTANKSAKAATQSTDDVNPLLLQTLGLLNTPTPVPVPTTQTQATVSSLAANSAVDATPQSLPAVAQAESTLPQATSKPDFVALQAAQIAVQADAAGQGVRDGQQKLPPTSADQATNLPPDLAAQQLITSTPASGAGTRQLASQAPNPQFYIDQQVGSPGWSKAIADHVLAMVTLKADTAHIQLNPPQLGPIEVTLHLDGHNNAQLTLTADSAVTRGLLQDSLPKLHAMITSSGIQLGDAQVSSGHSQQQQQGSQTARRSVTPDSAENEELDTLATIKAARDVLSIFA